MGKKRDSSSAARGASTTQQKGQQGGRIAGAKAFVRDTRSELRRVSWPNRDQLQQSTVVVLIIVLLLTAYVAAWDFVFQTLARLIFL